MLPAWRVLRWYIKSPIRSDIHVLLLLYPPYACLRGGGYNGLVVVTPRPQKPHCSRDNLKSLIELYAFCMVFLPISLRIPPELHTLHCHVNHRANLKIMKTMRDGFISHLFSTRGKIGSIYKKCLDPC